MQRKLLTDQETVSKATLGGWQEGGGVDVWPHSAILVSYYAAPALTKPSFGVQDEWGLARTCGMDGMVPNMG